MHVSQALNQTLQKTKLNFEKQFTSLWIVFKSVHPGLINVLRDFFTFHSIWWQFPLLEFWKISWHMSFNIFFHAPNLVLIRLNASRLQSPLPFSPLAPSCPLSPSGPAITFQTKLRHSYTIIELKLLQHALHGDHAQHLHASLGFKFISS